MAMTTLFKAVPPSGVTRGTLDWNVPTGTDVRCDHNVADVDHGEVCPRREGDGITIAKTWAGAALAGFPTVRCCTVEVDPLDVLAEDDVKMRVRAVTVGEWFDATDLLRQGFGAGADLADADLAGAYLADADLARANLAGAYLAGADLARAYLADANLARADLARADLADANLARAYLADADLADADLGVWERGPDGYARKKGTP